MKKILYATPLLFIVLLVSFFWYKLDDDPRRLPSALLNKPVPVFSARNLQNKRVTQMQFRDHVSVLNVWATWCMSCHSEHPFLMDIAMQKKVRVIGLDYKDSRSAAQHWLLEYGNPYYQCIYDPEGKLAMQLGVYGTPETFLIDRSGIIRYKHIGELDAKVWVEEFVPRIKRLMS